MVLRQYGQWALVLFILGFLMPGVNNIAHAGGFVGGFAVGLGLSLAEQRSETGLDQLLAAGAIGVTVLGFVLALWSAFV
jgi:rhomboid protease GluP